MANFELNVKINGVEQTVSTIGGLEQALAETNAQLAKVEENSKEFTFLKNQASNLDKVMVALTSDTADLNKNLKTVNTTSQQLNNSFTATAQAANDIGQSTAGVSNFNEELQQTATTSSSLRQELRQVTLELQNLEPGSARFQELSNRAGELRDQIADTNAVINATAGTVTERFGRALASSVQIGIAGFQAIQSAQALFGIENQQVNESLVRFAALLNLSQAIETFGGLGDRITEIRAGFAALTTQTAVQTVATEGATVATTGLGLAMKALPIVALVAGVATLVAGLVSYLNTTDKTNKAEEERKKKQEALTKANKEQSEAVAKESTALVQLLYQLKTTNAGSDERLKLIKEINKDYDTTLKNLKDEAMFQEQVNSAIEDYITYQMVKFKLGKNQEYFNQQLEKATNAEREYNTLIKQFNKDRFQAGDVITRYNAALGVTEQVTLKAAESLGSYRDRNQIFNTELVKTEKNLNDAKDALNSLTERRNQLIKEETELTKNLFKAQNDNNKATSTANKLAKDQTALAQFNNDLKKQAIALQDEEARNQTKKTSSVVDDLDLEKTIALRNLKDRFDEAIKTDKAEVKEKRKSKSEAQQIEKSYYDAVAKLNEDYNKRIQRQKNIEADANTALFDELLIQNKILQDEILFGDQNTLDSKESLYQREKALQIKTLEDRLSTDNLSLDNFRKLLSEKIMLQTSYNNKQLVIDLAIAKANSDRDLANFIKLEAQLLNVKIVENKKKVDEDDATFKKRIQTEGAYIVERENGDKVYRQNFTREEEQAYQNIIQQKVNLDEEYSVKSKELTAATSKANGDLITSGDEETNQKRLDILDEFFSTAKSAIDSFANTQVGGYSAIVSQSLNSIQEYFKLVDQDFANTTDKIAAYATAITGILNGIVSGFLQQNQAAADAQIKALQDAADAEKDIQVRKYNDEVALQKDRLAQGLISEEEYRSAIDTLNFNFNNRIKGQDDTLAKEQRKIRQKAFDDEKKLKIAQAVISGLQGAVQAFAGAMQLGPIAGPIVGAILAAAVAGLAAANVAQIRKTQLGGTTETQASTELAPGTSATSVASSPMASTGGFTAFTSQAGGGAGTAPSTGTATFTSPQKVYVLESDITSAQDRVRVLESNSTFG